MGNKENLVGQTDKKKFKMSYNPMNPNTLIPFYADKNKIISQRVIEYSQVEKSNFIFRKVIGRSQFGTIWLVDKIPEIEPMVVKVMEKTEIYRR